MYLSNVQQHSKFSTQHFVIKIQNIVLAKCAPASITRVQKLIHKIYFYKIIRCSKENGFLFACPKPLFFLKHNTQFLAFYFDPFRSLSHPFLYNSSYIHHPKNYDTYIFQKKKKTPQNYYTEISTQKMYEKAKHKTIFYNTRILAS